MEQLLREIESNFVLALVFEDVIFKTSSKTRAFNPVSVDFSQ